MKTTKYIITTILTVLATIMLYGCPKSAAVSSAPEGQKVEQAPAKPAEDVALKAAEQKRAAEEKAAQERSASAAGGLKPIYFDFDKSFIREDAKAAMKANADYLKANPKVKVRIEGNCDERGTIEYNQALGQRRAASAKKYLQDLGISGKRISLISYGKEKQVCREGTEDCWQKNRRDELVAASD